MNRDEPAGRDSLTAGRSRHEALFRLARQFGRGTGTTAAVRQPSVGLSSRPARSGKMASYAASDADSPESDQ
jgi:hypothetical protein